VPDVTPTEIDAFLAALPADQRVALEQLRNAIRLIVPEATEFISYGVPTFRYHGALVAFGAAQQHCSLYVMRPALVASLSGEISPPFRASGGTIQFPADAPLPAGLLERVVRARMAENEAAARARSRSSPRTARPAR
jgi:uncharacterized protein YdhG (YjbR/CyaY superfamily)